MAVTTTLKLYFKTPDGKLIEATPSTFLKVKPTEPVQFQVAASVVGPQGSPTVYTSTAGSPLRPDAGRLENWMVGDENGKETPNASINSYGLFSAKKAGKYKIAALWTTVDDAGVAAGVQGSPTFVVEVVSSKLWLWLGGAAVLGLGTWWWMRRRSATKALKGW